MKTTVLFICIFITWFQSVYAQVWISDQGNGSYKNPVLYADYSDPDLIRVGDDYYLTASSFNCVPGLPILHSKDLINWKIVNYALPELRMEGVEPANFFDTPQHGKGVWAPCIRHHKGEFYIYWGDPDFGIYAVKTKDILGKWDKPVLVLKGKGRIDPSPLFDDDGRVYLVHAWAGSRAGLNSVLTVCELSGDGTKVIAQEALVFDGNDGVNHTVEGGKFYKKDGYYYILAPAGGVATGWQIALRSKNVYGPYEVKKVLAQGTTGINGPHQGGLVDTPTGEWWFMHFQDKGAYGRIVHLQPVTWKDGWPVMGINDRNYCGEPALTHKKPNLGKIYPVETPQESDEFNSTRLGFQWQWHANPGQAWGFPSANGYLRMYAQYYPENCINMWDIPNLLLQKLTAPEFTATAKVSAVLRNDGDKAGFIVMGWDYSHIALVKKDAGYVLEQTICRDAEQKNPERKAAEIPLQNLQIDKRLNYQTPVDKVLFYFRLTVEEGALCTFSYSVDGKEFYPFGEPFQARQGKWIGAKMGLFILNKTAGTSRSWADIDWFRVENAPAYFVQWAKTPPMGWNSWDCYGPTVEEHEVKANADYMAEHLKPYGWEYIVVDIRWFVENDKAGGYNQTDPRYVMDEYGRYLPAINRFPSAADNKGFKPLADYIHSKGLKFGIHIMRGVPKQAVEKKLPIKGTPYTVDQIYSTDLQCEWLRDNYTIIDKPGAQEYYNSLMELYASWDVDFLKIDDLSRPYHKREIEMIRKAIDHCGRPVVLSISPGETPVSEALHVKNHANMWRMVDDVWDTWGHLTHLMKVAQDWYPHIALTWPDCDMIPLGRISIRGERGKDRMTRLTQDEQYSLMTFFTIFRSPLMFGGDLPGNDEFTLSLLTNREVLKMHRESTDVRQLFREDGKIAVTSRNTVSCEHYLAVFNISDNPEPAEIQINLPDVGINDRCTIKNLWTGESTDFTGKVFSVTLRLHECRLFKMI